MNSSAQMASTAKRKSSIDSEHGRHSLSSVSGGANSFQFSLPELDSAVSLAASVGSKRSLIKSSVENPTVTTTGRILPKKRKCPSDSEGAALHEKSQAFLTGAEMSVNCLEAGSLSGSGISPSLHISPSLPLGQSLGNSALEHLEALGDEVAAPRHNTQEFFNIEESAAGNGDDNSHSTFASSSQRLLLEAFFSGSGMDSKGRDRLESWGGMSDLSLPLIPNTNSTAAAAALAASALQQSGIIDDAAATANLGLSCGASAASSGSHDPAKSCLVPSKISLGRDRMNSIASLSESSAIPISVDGMELSNDLQAFVSAAMASVGNQLSDLAGAVESAASGADTFAIDAVRRELGIYSDASSIASPLIGAISDQASRISGSGLASMPGLSPSGEFLASSTGAISVDYDAVAAAVDAAEAATGALDLASIGHIATTEESENLTAVKAKSRKRSSRRIDKYDFGLSACMMPDSEILSDRMAASASSQIPVPKSNVSGKQLEEIRERARAAAGYIPPGALDGCLQPAKKRSRPFARSDMGEASQTTNAMPKVSSTGIEQHPNVPCGTFLPLANAASNASKGQSSQKWDSMFQCLLEFIGKRREEETLGASEQDKSMWSWDGNVPTTYKTSDGKALGRWINNQRSAKSKGTLKNDREQRLVGAGLKWSVLASNSWNEMLEELRDYVRDQTKEEKKWDGNVPTNYRIKARTSGRLVDEDKNLGRWVNRQRSLYQAGKLRKDRQLALENVGLKWSMLATTSWESMFETLCEYVEAKKKEVSDWDGNVPANYRTNDNPPRALGRWINRQRSAYVKNKLKDEYVEKLNAIGLKWSVHERKLAMATPTEVVPSVPNILKAMDNVEKNNIVIPKVEAIKEPPAADIIVEPIRADEVISTSMPNVMIISKADATESSKADTKSTLIADAMSTSKVDTMSISKIDAISNSKADTLSTSKAGTLSTIKTEELSTLKADEMDVVKDAVTDVVNDAVTDVVTADVVLSAAN